MMTGRHHARSGARNISMGATARGELTSQIVSDNITKRVNAEGAYQVALTGQIELGWRGS
jgi:hypothetical protein